MNLSGWGRFPRAECDVRGMREPRDARAAMRAQRSVIARGNGRSYGDAAVNPDGVVSTLPSDRIHAFDPQTGRITCEAGLMLADLLAFAVPRGFFPPVTPGTKFVTVGGMAAADVHGKNHHRAGSFGHHIEHLELMIADGTVRVCSRTENPDVFAATLGGMGLTGIILTATFRLLPIETAVIRQETLIAADFDEAMEICEVSSDWTYTVAWIDCLSRGSRLGRAVVYRGEHASRQEQPDAPLALSSKKARRLPIDLPTMALNPWSLRAFNEVYYRRAKSGTSFLDYNSYFYPLDALLDWNRLYGRAGFTQYQCVIPKRASRDGMRAILQRVSDHGRASFLAVLKLFGEQGDGLLSFPLEGYTLTLDFPVNAAVLGLLLELDAIVADHGGRVYLAKDARSGAAMMRQGYPRLDRFRDVRNLTDPTRKFQSLQSRRLDL